MNSEKKLDSQAVNLKQGDIIKLDLSPKKGHEQDGYRPVLVISNDSFNKRNNVVWVVPITNQIDDFPGNVKLETINGDIQGNILCAHIGCIDPSARHIKVVDKATKSCLLDCKGIIDATTFLSGKKQTTSKFKQGDIIEIDFSPTKGQEQQGYQKAIVISEDSFNKINNTMWVLPISDSTDDFPGHANYSDATGKPIGSILCEHIKSVDQIARNPKLIGKATNQTMVNCKIILDASTFI